MYESFVDTARRAARAGADQLRGRWGQRLEIESKKAYDFVTDADLASERAVLSLIAERHPEHAILSEESSPDQGQELAAQGPLWVVDPLDGTTNYIHGFPHVAVSIALLLEGRPVVGVIRDVMRGEEFWAARGQGAWLDGEPIKVRQADSPGRSLLMTGFPFREKDILDTYLELFKELFSATAGVRRAGSAALDLAYVAAGRGQGFWELGLAPWDVAAGIVLVTEAGGLVSDFNGGDKALWQGDIVAAAPSTHAWVQEACQRHFPHRC